MINLPPINTPPVNIPPINIPLTNIPVTNLPVTGIPALDQLSKLSTLGTSANGAAALPNLNDLGHYLIIAGGISTAIMVLALWSLVWKGIALWYAARRGEKGWFTWLLVLNTLGILEIIYIFAVAKRSDKKPPAPAAVEGQRT
jgi:methionyl-tRNA synthetase